MKIYEDYRESLEAEHGQALKDILIEVYITQNLGLSCGAKQLGIPRHVFLHFRNEYGLKPLKHRQGTSSKQNELC